MSEKPSIFTGDMVRAILQDRKDVTRRVIKPQPESTEMCPVVICKDVQSPSGYSFSSDMIGTVHIKPKYQKGDILWVKEPLVEYEIDDVSFTEAFYEADLKPCGVSWQWKKDRLPGMFMPKNFTRIWLEVIDVRPERLQDITDEDAIREGIQKFEYMSYSVGYGTKKLALGVMPGTAREAFRRLWNKINAKRGFPREDNPWVWRIEFKKVKISAD